MQQVDKKPICVRDDFRRDGLSATFKVSKAFYHKYLLSFPEGSRINIGYPSICESEYQRCSEILELERAEGTEVSTVGHARPYDLKVMAGLIRNHDQVSANIWLPSSNSACHNILSSRPEEVLQNALDSIKLWKNITDLPLDIALTDITNDTENRLGERVISWYCQLMDAGYRSVILCDTKGVGNIERLAQVFNCIGDFEWHPHDDGELAKTTADLAIDSGATHIGTSYLRCSERMNMLDPREVLADDRSKESLESIARDFPNEVEEVLKLRDKVYGKNTFVTGTHFKLWGNNKVDHDLLFGVTTDSQLYKLMTGQDISSEEIARMKDELLYQTERAFLTRDELLELKVKI